MAGHIPSSVVPLDQPSAAVDATPPTPLALAPLELPRARRPGWPTLAALAIGTGLAAIALGAWAVVDEVRSDTATPAEPAVAVLADSTAQRHVLRGSVGRIALVVTGSGDAVLTLDGLGEAPGGSTYQAWVVPRTSATPLPDVTFDGSSPVVALERAVPRGARVGVTLEPAGGASYPSRALRLVATRS